jgi:flagellar biosynthesis protein FlhG
VERAYRYHVSLYSDASVATYSLLDSGERQQARAQVQEAYDVLKDPLRRRAYDASQGIESVMGPPMSVQQHQSQAPAAPGTPPVTLEGPVTGAALRRVREGKGIPLEQIAVRSKIGLRYLQSIEADKHQDLPPRVYLRGFLLEYARALGLDAAPTADAYLAALPKAPTPAP